MKGVHYIIDEKKNKVAVQIDLRTNRALWEDFCDHAIYVARKNEKRVSLDSVIKKIKKSSGQ